MEVVNEIKMIPLPTTKHFHTALPKNPRWPEPLRRPLEIPLAPVQSEDVSVSLVQSELSESEFFSLKLFSLRHFCLDD